MKYATEVLNDKGVFVSADIFGQVTTNKDDMGLGQQLEDLTVSTNILCPMVYPSHYYPRSTVLAIRTLSLTKLYTPVSAQWLKGWKPWITRAEGNFEAVVAGLPPAT